MTEINNEVVINAIENVDVDNIKKVIELFSRYLVCSNNDYYYNETYLPRFVEGFCEFNKYYGMKSALFLKICQRVEEIDNNIVIELDDFIFWKKKIYLGNKLNKNTFCRHEAEIKLISRKENQVLAKTKKYPMDIRIENIDAKITEMLVDFFAMEEKYE